MYVDLAHVFSAETFVPLAVLQYACADQFITVASLWLAAYRALTRCFVSLSFAGAHSTPCSALPHVNSIFAGGLGLP